MSENQKWISCTERLPEKVGEFVLVTVEEFGKRWVEIMYKCIDDGWSDNFYKYTDEIVAWMPLPEPYDPQERSDKE